MNAPAAKRYRPETRLVHAGILRSEFGETSEALFLTQGYVYETSASAERRFKGEEAGYQYSRFSNPTVAMFEARGLNLRLVDLDRGLHHAAADQPFDPLPRQQSRAGAEIGERAGRLTQDLGRVVGDDRHGTPACERN